MWSIATPSLFHILIPNPRPDEPKPATTVRYIPLNRTTVTALEIAELHTKEKYKETEPFEGAFHPFDGWLERTGINLPFAYFMWGLSKVPTWVPIVIVSFISRTVMSVSHRHQTKLYAFAYSGYRSRRMQPQQGPQAGAAQPAQ